MATSEQDSTTRTGYLASCRVLEQGISMNGTSGGSYSHVAYDEVNDSLKVCAASPGCSNCVDMVAGDCRYVFPTKVMVYTRHVFERPELCACQVFACDLPWDPAGWSRKCILELGCITKPPKFDDISITDSLCGRNRDVKVRFVPLTFKLQNYFDPGLAAGVYKNDELLSRKYEKVVPARTHSAVLLRKAEGRRRKRRSTQGDTALPLDDRTISAKVPKDGTNKTSARMFHYTAEKRGDTMCVQYYGENSSRSVSKPIYETCLPIPFPQKPLFYVGHRDSRDPKIKNQSVDGFLWNMMRYGAVNYKSLVTKEFAYSQEVVRDFTRKRRRKRYDDVKTEDVLGHQYVCLRHGGGGAFSNNGECKSMMELLVNFSKDVVYHKPSKPAQSGQSEQCVLQEKRVLQEDGASSDDNEVVAEWFEGHVFKEYGLANVGYYYGMLEDLEGECRVSMRHPIVTNGNSSCAYTLYPVMPEGRVYSLSNLNEIRKEVVETEVVTLNQKYGSDNAKRTLRYNIPILPVEEEQKEPEIQKGYKYVGEVMCERMPQGNVEFDVLSIDGCSDVPSKCRGHGGFESQFRVRKKTKRLRRYVIVNNNGISRRIRCDDRFSIDLRTLGQNVLDKVIVEGSKFILPREFLGDTISDGTDDPCRSSKSKIAYYYEEGGFIEKADLKKCGVPIVEMFAPGKVVKGCEYTYERTDNYEPFLEGSGDHEGFSIVPLSQYEQGFCLDNFASVWFVPRYVTNNSTRIKARKGSSQQQSICYKERKGDGSSKEPTVRYRYAFSIPGKSEPPVCTFYKVEMWGGGEAATRLEGSKQKRSGRPGQYVSLLMDFAAVQDGNIGSKRAEIAGHGFTMDQCGAHPNYAKTGAGADRLKGQGYFSCKEAERVQALGKDFYLVAEVGEGGVPGVDDGKGKDTILSLCSGNKIEWPKDEGVRELSVSRTEVDIKKYTRCYEVARAVGGGSVDIVRPEHHLPPSDYVLKYYTTIYGDVLRGDYRALQHFLDGNAMFTKFPLKMNMDTAKGKNELAREIVLTGQFERTLPRKFCTYKASHQDKKKQDDKTTSLFIPGMGGCWDASLVGATGGVAAGESKKIDVLGDNPGVGQSGAIMITCERWKQQEEGGGEQEEIIFERQGF